LIIILIISNHGLPRTIKPVETATNHMDACQLKFMYFVLLSMK